MNKNELVRKKGFTLMELLVVIAIIGILSAVGVGQFTTSLARSRDTQRKNDLNQISKMLNFFSNEVGGYPVSDVEGKPMCFDKQKSAANPYTTCVGNAYYINLGSFNEVLMQKYPSDPDGAKKYVYQKTADGFELYAAIENTEDKDINKDANGWGVNCGAVFCNYKINEAGLVRNE